jgi:hypothetical protein
MATISIYEIENPKIELLEDFLDTAMLRAAEVQIRFSHDRPNGESCFSAFPAREYHSVGENIAIGHTDPTDVMNAWMNSPGHKENILDPSFQSVGVGCFAFKGLNGRHRLSGAIQTISTFRKTMSLSKHPTTHQ